MDLPEDVASALRARPAGRTWLEAMGPGVSFDDIATAAGLRALGPEWIELDRDGAGRILAEILHRDLAYGAELMPGGRAQELAEQFLEAVADDRSRFGTNCEGPPNQGTSHSWTPATAFTFDAGVVVSGPTGSALCWVADED